jgi:folate-binding protein YgfZ
VKPEIPQSNPGSGAASTVLRLEGRDALALLHRISTQALEDLSPGAARYTLFCDFRGRLLHRAAVAVTDDAAVWLLRDDAPADELAALLDRSVFREDVRVRDLGGELEVHGVPAGARPEAGSVRERGGRPEGIHAEDGRALAVVPAGSAHPEPDELRRIRGGWPRHGHEIAEAFTPFEVGLARDVHLSKGCYTGQEALQRLITYGSVRRGLARLEGAGPPPAAPGEVLLEDRAVGRLTSSVADGDGWVGLGVVSLAVARGSDRLRAGGSPVRVFDPIAAVRPLGLP